MELIDREKLIEDTKLALENIKQSDVSNTIKASAEINLLTEIELIESQPTVNTWISVEDRLPEEAYGCFVIIDSDYYDGYSFTNCEEVLPYVVGYDGKGWNNWEGERIPFEVIAWMPIPEYKESE